MGGSSSQPWRSLPEREKTLDFVKSYKPQNKEVKHLRILLHGPVGAGKSSFINSVDSFLQGRVTGRALADANFGPSFTRKYKTYNIQKDPGTSYSFSFNDTMGLEENTNQGIHLEDIKLALKGHVKEGYQFIPGKQLGENDEHYNSCPTLDDRAHVLVSVVAVGTVSLLSDSVWKKMRDVRLAASEYEIPQLAVLTKVDEACPEVKENIKNVYVSKYLKEQVDKFSMKSGLPVSCIFLVKNYSSEVQPDDEINAEILCALKQMVTFGEDYLNNL